MRFHKDEVRFLGYVVLALRVRMEDETIEAVKNLPEPKSVRDIQVWLRKMRCWVEVNLVVQTEICLSPKS